MRIVLKSVEDEDLINNKNIWKKVIEIGSKAFSKLENIREIEIPGNVNIIGDDAFSGCQSIEKLVIKKGVKKIGAQAFSFCANLKEIVIPSSVTKIGMGAFFYSDKLERIILSSKIDVLDEDLFKNCKNLKEIVIPLGVKKINAGAFACCFSLKKIEIPSSVKVIENSAFCLNYGLEKIIFNEGLEEIGFLAFEENKNIKEIYFPNTLKKIGSHAFLNCVNLKKIKLNEGLVELEAESFKNCVNLIEVSVPGSVKCLEHGIFSFCENLERIELNEGLEKIEDFVFNGCRKLNEIKIPKSIKFISPLAFDYNRFKYLVIKDDGSIVLCVNREDENGKTYSISNIFSLFPNVDLSIILKNREKAIDILDKIEEYKDTMIAIPSFAVDSYEKLIKVCSEELKIMKKLCDLSNEKVSPINIADLYKLAHCMGAFESKGVTILVNDKNIPVRDFAYTVLQGAFNRGDLNFEDLHMRFQSLKTGKYNEEFLKFVANKTNLNELKQEDNNQSGFTVRVYEWFEERKNMNIAESNLSGLPDLEENRYKIRIYDTGESGIDRIKWKVPTVSLLKKEFIDKRFKGVIDGRSAEIAEYFNGFNLYSQRHFDKALEIDKERKESGVRDHITNTVIKESIVDSVEDYKKRTKSMRKRINAELNDISNKQVDIASRIFTYEMLSKSDKANFAMGLLTSCCATLYGAGAGAQRAMIIHPDIQPLVIRDARGNISAFGIVYVNREKGYAVINNFEVNNKYSYDVEVRKEIYTKAKQGVEAFVSQYNKENREKPISIVTCGISPNWEAINEYIKENPKSSVLEAPDFDDFKYAGSGSWSGDWHKEQYVIWKKR